MTDGVTEALEGGTVSIRDALIQAARSGLEDPADLCAYLMRIASEGAGPLGAEGWQDDRTSLAFRVLPTSRVSGRASPHAPVASPPPHRGGVTRTRSVGGAVAPSGTSRDVQTERPHEAADQS